MEIFEKRAAECDLKSAFDEVFVLIDKLLSAHFLNYMSGRQHVSLWQLTVAIFPTSVQIVLNLSYCYARRD